MTQKYHDLTMTISLSDAELETVDRIVEQINELRAADGSELPKSTRESLLASWAWHRLSDIMRQEEESQRIEKLLLAQL